eukprot:m.76329 g.76329  ORF g.76329 m.76329 type:complete len:68 (+) comp12484_c0_seq3:683-886(+)
MQCQFTALDLCWLTISSQEAGKYTFATATFSFALTCGAHHRPLLSACVDIHFYMLSAQCSNFAIALS